MGAKRQTFVQDLEFKGKSGQRGELIARAEAVKDENVTAFF